jgi:D-sedoheptulose 7-phosphate isomerase
MHDFTEQYFNNLTHQLQSIKIASQNGKPLEFFQGLETVIKLIIEQTRSNKKIIFIGNGASAGIASHMSTDYLKNGGMRAVAFNDSSLLTCISNDYGYQHVFEKPIEMLADEGDILMAISSSGKSENILRGAKAARSKNCKIITFSGFSPENPLSQLGDYNFYVPSQEYGPVEITHLSICHCIVDTIISRK